MQRLPIFVSSTFVDFFPERDSIMRVVRVALDDRVRHLGCEVEIIDLRWGLDVGALGEDELQNRVLDVCVSEVRRAAPLFLGLVGHRYGWRPAPERAAALAARHALDPVAVRGLSVTALEQREGVRQAGSRCIFLLREPEPGSPPAWLDEDPSAIAAHRDWLLSSGATCARYSVAAAGGSVSVGSLRTFERLAVELLEPVVLERAVELSGAPTVDPHVRHRDAVLERSVAAAHGRDDDARRLAGMVSAGRSVCLFGQPGSGRTTLTALVGRSLAPDGPSPVLVGPEFGVVDGDDVQREVDELARVRPGSGVVVLDGAERLAAGSSGDALEQLAALARGRGVMITTSDRTQAERLAHVGCEVVVVAPLEPDDMVSVAVTEAGRRGKVLPPGVLQLIRTDRRSPRWVHLAISELLASDEDGPITALSQAEIELQLTERFADLGPTDEVLVAMAIERARRRLGTASTDRVLGLLACSRLPLAVSDLASLAALTTLEVLELRYLCDELLAFSADERLLLAGGHVRAVITEGMTDAEALASHSTLGDWYAAMCRRTGRSALAAREVGWHAGHADGAVGLATALGPGPMPEGTDRVVLSAYTAALGEGTDLAAPLHELQSLSRDQLELVAWFTDRSEDRRSLGTRAAFELVDATVVRTRELSDDPVSLARMLMIRADVAHLAHRPDDAAQSLEEARALLAGISDDDATTVPVARLAIAYHNLAATVLEDLGRLPDALECYRTACAVLADLEAAGAPDPHALSTILLNYGKAARAHGDAELARTCHDEAVTIAAAQLAELSGDLLVECMRVLIDARSASTEVRLIALGAVRGPLDAAIAGSPANAELLGMRRSLADASVDVMDEDRALATSAIALHLASVRAKFAIDGLEGPGDELELADALHARGSMIASLTEAGPLEDAHHACLEALAIYRRHAVAELPIFSIRAFTATLRNLAASPIHRDDPAGATELLDEGIRLVEEWTKASDAHPDLEPIYAVLLCERADVIPEGTVTPAVTKRAALALGRAFQTLDEGTADWMTLRAMIRPLRILEGNGENKDRTLVAMAEFGAVLTIDGAFAETVGTYLRDRVARIAAVDGPLSDRARVVLATLDAQLIARAVTQRSSVARAAGDSTSGSAAN